MSSTFDQHQSRFGFHPCDYLLFSKLKYLHKHYWITVRQFHTWHRWFRKEPQNRIGMEPNYCKAFIANQRWAKPVKTGFKIYPRTVRDHDVLKLYPAARLPSPEPVKPFSPETTAAIETLYVKVQTHFEEEK